MTRFVLTSFLFCIQLLLHAQSSELYPVQLSNARDFGGRVNAIFQDKTGFIWIGKETGLFRYDGREMKAYRHLPADTNSIAGNNILSIHEDSAGNLLVGTRGAGLNYYNRASDRFVRYLHNEKDPRSISYNEIQTMEPDGKGQFLIGTDGGGINLFSPASGSFRRLKANAGDSSGLKSNKILRIKKAGANKYWVSTWGGGFYLYDLAKDSITQMGAQSPFARTNVYCVREVSRGLLWIATWGQGLLSYNINSRIFTTIIPPSRIANIRDIFIGPKGDIWVASIAGLLHFSSPVSDYRLVSGAAEFESVSRVYIDRSGIVWVGAENGSVGKINPSRKKFELLPASDPSSKSPIDAMLADKVSGHIYFSANNSISRYDPVLKSIRTWPLPFNGIAAMSAVSGGSSILCSHSEGLFIFDKIKGSFIKLKMEGEQAEELKGKQIWTMAQADSSSWWIGVSGFACRIGLNEDKQLSLIKEIIYPGASRQLPLFHYPSSFLFDTKNNFWMGTWGGGLNKLPAGSSGFISYTHQEQNARSISDNFVECLIEGANGQILAATHVGLNYYQPGNEGFHAVTVNEGLASDWLVAAVMDQKENVWLSSRKGISMVRDGGKIIRNYDFNDGLPANVFVPRSAAADNKGNLYFGSVAGLVWFHPDSISDNKILPEPVLTGFKVNDDIVKVGAGSPLTQNIELVKKISLSERQSAFSFQMAALSYFNPSRNRIRYKLEGYDKEWKLAGAEQTASYSAIPPGQYRFLFMVSNEDGLWNNKVRALELSVEGNPWVSAGAIAGYVVLLLALGSLLYYKQKAKPMPAAVMDIPGLKTGSGNELIQPSKVEVTPADLLFLQKAVAVVEEHISDADFKVDQFCDKMFMSRPQLYRKLHAIAGLTITEFIKEVRLKRAAQLIAQKPGNISEIAYEVGFNDPKYFSKCFKQLFGVSPGQYKAPDEQILP